MPWHYKLSLIDLIHRRLCSPVLRTCLQNTGHHASALRAVTNRSETLATLFSCYGTHTLTKYWSPCLGITSCHSWIWSNGDSVLLLWHTHTYKILVMPQRYKLASSISIQQNESNCSKRLLFIITFPKIESINGGSVASELWPDDYLNTDILTNGSMLWVKG